MFLVLLFPLWCNKQRKQEVKEVFAGMKTLLHQYISYKITIPPF